MVMLPVTAVVVLVTASRFPRLPGPQSTVYQKGPSEMEILEKMVMTKQEDASLKVNPASSARKAFFS